MSANFEKALTHTLKNDPGLDELILGRVYPLALPQNVTFPALTYQIINQRTQRIHGSPSILPMPRVQFTCWGTKFEQTVTLGMTLKSAIDGMRDDWGTGSNVTEVESVLFADQRDFKDPETGLFYRQQDYHIMWKE